VELKSGLLLTIACVGTIGVLAALIVFWRRLRRWWIPMRVVLILLGEALLLFSVALEVNRVGDFYPSWSALMGHANATHLPDEADARLGDWIQAKASQGTTNGVIFSWRPPGLESWHLGAAPVAYLPAAYFHSPSLQLPVIVVLAPTGSDPSTGAWDDAGVDRLIKAANIPACVVFLRTGKGLDLANLADSLPTALTADLPVMRHRWALVGVGPAAATAVALHSADTTRFGPLALVPVGEALPVQLVREASTLSGGELLVTPVVARTGPTADGRPTHKVLVQPSLVGALRWAYPLLPPALEPPQVLPTAAPRSVVA
jgi:hypothetical protein